MDLIYIHRPNVASCRRRLAEWRSATPEGARILADEHTRTSGHFCVLDVAS